MFQIGHSLILRCFQVMKNTNNTKIRSVFFFCIQEQYGESLRCQEISYITYFVSFLFPRKFVIIKSEITFFQDENRFFKLQNLHCS